LEGSNVLWPMKGGETPFHMFPLSPQQILFKLSFFSIDFKVLLYHGSRSLFAHFFPFHWPINYNHAFWCNKSSTHSLPIWLKIKYLFSFPWNYGVVYGHVLWASSCTNEWRITSIVISKFNIDTTSSWWKSRTMRGVCSSWSWTLSNLILSHFSKHSHLNDFVTSWPHF
jgi:hypothetical protein